MAGSERTDLPRYRQCHQPFDWGGAHTRASVINRLVMQSVKDLMWYYEN
jgi:hypothetical protein